MEEQSIRAALKIAGSETAPRRLHKMLDSIDQGNDDTEIAGAIQWGVKMQLIRRVLRDKRPVGLSFLGRWRVMIILLCAAGALVGLGCTSCACCPRQR